MSKDRTEYYDTQATNIYRWFEANKHRFKDGVTSSTFFSEVVEIPSEPGVYFPPHVRAQDPLSGKYYNVIMRMRRKGYIVFEPQEPGGPRVWRVVEAMLPTGTVNYTGVRQLIPTPVPTPAPAPAPAPHPEAAQAFLDAELKAISIPYTMIRREGVLLELTDQNLYTIFKLGQILNANTEPCHEPTPETQPTEDQDILDPSSEPTDTAASETTEDYDDLDDHNTAPF